jgi:hypothetical protein
MKHWVSGGNGDNCSGAVNNYKQNVPINRYTKRYTIHDIKLKSATVPDYIILFVGQTGFEPATLPTRSGCAIKSKSIGKIRLE